MKTLGTTRASAPAGRCRSIGPKIIRGMLAAAVCASSGAVIAQDAGARALVLINANVVSTLDGSIERNATVAIADRRIQRVSKSDINEPVPAGARVLDLAGRYLVPGLWDMHVHTFLDEHDPDWMFPLFAAHGVTGVRDMGSLVSLPKMQRVRTEIERGTRLGPRVVLSGPLVDAAGADWLSPAGVPSLEESVQAVRRAQEQGADFVKIYPLISHDTYFAIVAEARRLGLPIAGQVPETVTVAEVANAGQRSIEHLEKLALACSGAEDEVVKTRRAALARARSTGELLDALSADTYAVIDRLNRLDEGRCKAMIATLARQRTAVIPTLVGVRIYMSAWRDRTDPRLVMLPRAVRETWLAMDSALRAAPTTQANAAITMARQSERLIALLNAGGVVLMAGTQTAPITPFVFPGAGLHDELVALERAGLTSLQALQAATLGPARYLGREAELGAVAAGRFADLIVLDGNPAQDIGQIRRIHAVVVNGRLIESAELDVLKRGGAGVRSGRDGRPTMNHAKVQAYE